MLYLSQVQQGLAIKTAVEGWRTLRPHCMGTLYWQLNDLWPVASWSSIEYGGKWKPLHHMARRFYAPVAVVAQPEIKDGRADRTRGRLYALNDTAQAVTGDLLVEYWTYDGKIVASEKKRVTLPPGSSTPVSVFGEGNLFSRAERAQHAENQQNNYFLVMTLKTPHGEFQNDWHFGFYKDRPLADAKVEVKVEGEEVTLGTDKPAFFVWVNACGIRGEFDDNALTLLPGRSRTLTFTSKGRPVSGNDFRKAIKVTHLYE